IFAFSFYGQETAPHAEFAVAGVPSTDASLSAQYGTGWAGRESSPRKIWRWAVGQSASITHFNARPQPVQVELAFKTTSPASRDLRVSVGDTVVWSGQADSRLQSA